MSKKVDLFPQMAGIFVMYLMHLLQLWHVEWSYTSLPKFNVKEVYISVFTHALFSIFMSPHVTNPQRELTFQCFFAKLELPLYKCLILQCLLHCYARVGGWELFITLISSNLTFPHSILRLRMHNAHCKCSCLIVCKQYKLATKWYIVCIKYLYHSYGINTHILFKNTNNKLWLTPSYLGRFNHLSSYIASSRM